MQKTYVLTHISQQANLILVNFKDTGYNYTIQLNTLALVAQSNDSTSYVSQTSFMRSDTVWSVSSNSHLKIKNTQQQLPN